MTDHVRILIRLARPSAAVIFGLFAATGLAQAGSSHHPALLMHVLVVVTAFLLFSVVINDLADRAIDEINLEGDAGRPLVVRTATDTEFLVIGLMAGCVALTAAALLSWPAVAVVFGGLVFSASYSLRPIRIADRGAAAALLLPLAYVAVPYLVGILSVRHSLTLNDLLLGAGLYTGFIGRILLKDFRDVRGDSLFGKRTFLVRHGRRWTCRFSAACWVAGMATLVAVRSCAASLLIAYVAHVALALGLLGALSRERGWRRDERLISAVALVGRSTVVTLIAHLSMTDARWSPTAAGAVLIAITGLTAGQAWTMVRSGPAQPRNNGVPDEFAFAVRRSRDHADGNPELRALAATPL